MEQYSKWVKKKSSGSYRRKVLAHRKKLLETVVFGRNNVKSVPIQNPIECSPTVSIAVNEEIQFAVPSSQSSIPEQMCPSSDAFNNDVELENANGDVEPVEAEYFSPSEDEDENFEPIEEDQLRDDEPLDVFLRKWAIEYNIRQYALKVLMAKLKKIFNASLPHDPRTLMRKLFFRCKFIFT